MPAVFTAQLARALQTPQAQALADHCGIPLPELSTACQLAVRDDAQLRQSVEEMLISRRPDWKCGFGFQGRVPAVVHMRLVALCLALSPGTGDFKCADSAPAVLTYRLILPAPQLGSPATGM